MTNDHMVKLFVKMLLLPTDYSIEPKIINYSQRKKSGLIFTSQMAESTVESLINQRCKGKQHMTWTREGIHPLLQVRAYVASNDWAQNWEEKVLGAMAKVA